MDTLKGLKRTHYCGNLSEKDVGKTVTVMGWADVYRNLGSLIFIDLRDRYGVIQLSFDTDVCKKRHLSEMNTFWRLWAKL